jgi:hypothetical protein
MRTVRTLAILFSLAICVCIFATTARATPLDDGLLAYWPFDLSMTDASGNGNDAIPHGGGYAEGVLGAGYEIFGNPANVFVELPNVINGRDTFSLSLWVNEQSLPHPHGEAYISFGRHGVDSTVATIFHNGVAVGNTVGCKVGSTAEPGGVSGPFDPAWVGQWQHHALTYDGVTGIYRGYVNGTLIGEANYAGAIYPTNDHAGLGKHWWVQYGQPDASTRLNATFDEVRIYDRALSEREVTLLSSIPEPSTLILATLGLLGLLTLARRRTAA